MASINFFSRVGNLWKGFLSLFIADIETAHPEIAYENAINSLVQKYTRLKSATAAIIRRRDDISSRFNDLTRQRDQINSDLNAAIATQQDDLSLVLIQKKNAVEADLKEMEVEAQQARSDADEAKNSLLSVKSEIEKLKSEKDRMLAKMTSAKARLSIQQQIEGLSVDAEVQTLDRVREHIKNTVAEANLGQELHDTDLDVRLKKLQQQGGDVSARAQLDEMKKARAAQGVGGKQM
ncbi:MAG: PspA/IM30 family protein [Dokdonella sp.]|uniref:PspA/IM30 family protein n=1 Tax=Dokdonella sp. TaxID=2291710 RepID=UPI003263211F